MKFSKNLLVSFLAIFILGFIVFKCSAVKKNQVIIGTDEVGEQEAYSYVMQALENGFYNIDTSSDDPDVEQNMGKAVQDFEAKFMGNNVYIISRFSFPGTFGGSVFVGDSLVENINNLEGYIRNKLDKSIERFGHVDEFVFNKKLPPAVSFSDVVRVFKELKQDIKYKNIKFGLSTVTVGEFDKLVRDNLIHYIQVVQNPYWYGSKFLLDLFNMGNQVYSKCISYKIKYETYRPLGRGRLVKERHFSPAALLQHSINKGYIPIVKATGQKHLSELVEKVDEEIVLPEVTWSSENSTFNIQILNYNQLDVINSKQYWYK